MKRIYTVNAADLEPRKVLSLKSLLGIFQFKDEGIEFKIVESLECDIAIIDIDKTVSAATKFGSNTVLIAAHSGEKPTNYQYTLKKPIIGRKVVNALNLVAKSELGYGGSDYVDNPAASLKREKAVVEEASSSFIRSVERPMMKVLVVDDSDIVRKSLNILLAKKNLRDVTFAKSGEEALALLERQEPYDTIFLDVVMPGIDGYKVCKAVKKSLVHKESTVVMLTSKSSRFDKVRASLVGCNHYLTKPIAKSAFMDFVDKLVGEQTRDAIEAPKSVMRSALSY